MFRFRPKLRFSLGTGFVLVTLVCVYLGWEVAVVRERTEVLRQIQELGGFARASSDPYLYQNFQNPPQSRLSYLRRLLGDQWIGRVSLPDEASAQVAERIQAVFPEATIRRDLLKKYPRP